MNCKKSAIILILSLFCLLLTGCDSVNNAQFVRSVVQSINTHKDVAGSLDSGGSTLYSLKTTPL